MIMMSNAIYIRTSTSKQDLESQISLCRAKAGKNAVIYRDAAISGKRDDRSGINQLLQDARDGKISKVYISELSRIGRSLGFIITTVEKLREMDVFVVLANSGMVIDQSTVEGKTLLGGLALAADIEHALIVERNKRGRIRMREKGSKPGRKPKDVSIVAIKAMLKDGKSATAIARELKVSKATVSRRIKSLKIKYHRGHYIAE